MLNDLIFPPNVFQPAEASILREATQKAVDRVRVGRELREEDRQRLAGDVILIARTGFSRTGDGLFDSDTLADAAAVRFLSFKSD
jgi:hypothetical protein